VATGCVYDDDLKALFFELLHTLCCYYHGVRLCVGTVVWDLGFRGILLELVEGTGSEGIRAHQTRLEASRLVPSCQLRTCRRLSRTLQTHEHDDV
jgi:hypothetical protein